VKQNFLQRFSNFHLKKKEKKERDGKKIKRKKEGRKKEKPNLLLIITLLFMSPTTQHYFLPFVPNKEISDIILIIRNNISSNGKNQYY